MQPSNELLDFLRNKPQTTATQSLEVQRVEEVDALLAYEKKLQSDEKRYLATDRVVFLGAGAMLLATGLATVAGWLPFLHTEGVLWFGASIIVLAGFYTLGRLQINPLDKLKTKMEEMHAHLVKPVPRAKPKGLFKSHRNKIIAGVASGLANLTGVPVSIIRVAFVGLMIFSGGAFIALYLLLALGLSFIPQEERM